MDEFAWLITQTRFGDAAKYLHPTLYDALNGDLTEKVDSNTMGIFWHNTRRNMPGLLQR